MRPASSLRFMLLFAAVAVGTTAASGLVVMLVFSFGWFNVHGNLVGFVPIVLVHVLNMLAAGWLQSRILARHRRPLRHWTLATFLGLLSGAILGVLTNWQSLGLVGLLGQGVLADVIRTLTLSGTAAACLGAAQALVIWGRRWTSDTFLWLTGLFVVHVAAGAMTFMIWRAAVPATPALWYSLAPLLSAAVVGAGAAWLLERIVFRVPAGPAIETGERAA
jgi:hypothetical protein